MLLPLSLLVEALSFTKEEKVMGGKEIKCPSCTKPLWVNDSGKIEPVFVLYGPERKNPLPKQIKCCFYALICKAIRKIRGLPPPPDDDENDADPMQGGPVVTPSAPPK